MRASRALAGTAAVLVAAVVAGSTATASASALPIPVPTLDAPLPLPLPTTTTPGLPLPTATVPAPTLPPTPGGVPAADHAGVGSAAAPRWVWRLLRQAVEEPRRQELHLHQADDRRSPRGC
ncbi:MAG: hypothetical protein ABJA93_14475 [Sporichthyaceae bacterium]